MRRIKPEYDFDIWIPAIAPSEALLKQYVINKTISWKKFKTLYIKEIIPHKQYLLQAILNISKKSTITLLCWEQQARYCHRSILLNLISLLTLEN